MRPQTRPSRLERSRRTDRAILDATIAILGDTGFSSLTLNAIARHCGKSTATIAARFATPGHAAAGAWSAHYGPLAARDLKGLLEGAGLLDHVAEESAFTAALERFQHPNRDWRAIGELLLISAFEPPLRAAIAHEAATVATWCTPTPPHVDLTLATQRAYVLLLGLGLTLVDTGESDDLTRLYRQLLSALRNPTPPQAIAVPIDTMPLEADTFDFHTQDPRERRLFGALLRVVAERGIDRATTQAIAKAADGNEGLLFNRYASKMDAFLDAVTQHQAILMQRQHAAALALGAHHPPAVVDAAVIQRSLDPAREASRAVATEYLRMARYHPVIANALTSNRQAILSQMQLAQPEAPTGDVRAWVHYGMAVGAGLGMLPLLVANTHHLPFNVVLEPLLAPPEGPVA